MERDGTLLQQIAQAGAVVVNDSFVDVTAAGQPLRIGGTMGHGFYFGRTQAEFEASPEYRFLTAFEDTDAPKICLAHMLDTFIFNGASTFWDADLRAYFAQTWQHADAEAGLGENRGGVCFASSDGIFPYGDECLPRLVRQRDCLPAAGAGRSGAAGADEQETRSYTSFMESIGL